MTLPIQDIERNIIKKYRKVLWSPFVKAVKEYELIQNGDKIAVAISGGKDSLLLAKLFEELHKNGVQNFSIEYIAMDPGYTEEKRRDLEENLKILGVSAHIYNTDIFEVAQEIAGEYPCYMCARMRRGSLYAKAKELGCNKVALGHHFDDIIETILLNILYGGKYNTMMPKLKSKNFENMELIRPMAYIKEKDIITFAENSGLNPLDCACTVTAQKTGNQRYQIKALLARLREEIPNVDMSIYRSAQNVNLNQILAYTKDGESHNFLENF